MFIPQEWSEILGGDLENSPLIKTLGEHHKMLRKEGKRTVVVPKEKDLIFSCFERCPYDMLKMVIVHDPSRVPEQFNGMCLGTDNYYDKADSKYYTKAVAEKHFEEILQKQFGENFKINDLSFDGIAKQGVLLLPTTHTSFLLRPNNKNLKALEKAWEIFNIRLIRAICRENEDITFLLIGEGAQSLLQHVNTKDGKGHGVYYSAARLKTAGFKALSTITDPINNAIKRVDKLHPRDKVAWSELGV